VSSHEPMKREGGQTSAVYVYILLFPSSWPIFSPHFSAVQAPTIMTANPAGLALEADPRDPHHPVTGPGAEPMETQLLRGIHDPKITFEEYMYYGAITRAEEKAANERYVQAAGPKTIKTVLLNRFSKGKVEPLPVDAPDSPIESAGEKNAIDEKGMTPHRNLGGVSDNEWKNASRAVRTAGWSSVFYLITTDILGPFSVPYVEMSILRNIY
jgi:hypothetical protein